MDLENTENNRALSIETLKELMQDIRIRTQARRESAARQKQEKEEAKRKEREETGRVARHSSDDDDDDYLDALDKKRGGMRRDASFSSGSALRESDAQIHRVFQLFDPKNRKMIPENEIILLLRAVAIDVDEKLLSEIIASQFSPEEQFQINRDRGVTFPQILRIIKRAASQSSGKHEARRVFETVLPEQQKTPSPTSASQQQQQVPQRGSVSSSMNNKSNIATSESSSSVHQQALKYGDFRRALAVAEARITDGELSEIYRYCSVNGNRDGLTLKDWEDVAEFVLENSD